jgi:hypothetical protein
MPIKAGVKISEEAQKNTKPQNEIDFEWILAAHPNL